MILDTTAQTGKSFPPFIRTARCRGLHSTVLAIADELAAAAGLAMPKSAGVPVALITGFAWNAEQWKWKS